MQAERLDAQVESPPHPPQRQVLSTRVGLNSAQTTAMSISLSSVASPSGEDARDDTSMQVNGRELSNAHARQLHRSSCKGMREVFGFGQGSQHPVPLDHFRDNLVRNSANWGSHT